MKDTASLVPLPICCIHDFVCGPGVCDLTRFLDDAVHGKSGEPRTQWVLWRETNPLTPSRTICCLLPVGLPPALRGRGSREDLALLVLTLQTGLVLSWSASSFFLHSGLLFFPCLEQNLGLLEAPVLLAVRCCEGVSDLY